MKNMVGV